MESCLAIIKAFPFLLDVVCNIKEWLSPHAEELHCTFTHSQRVASLLEMSRGNVYCRNYSHMKWEGPQQLLKTVPTGKPLKPCAANSEQD